jgi:hypothetical protein
MTYTEHFLGTPNRKIVMYIKFEILVHPTRAVSDKKTLSKESRIMLKSSRLIFHPSGSALARSVESYLEFAWSGFHAESVAFCVVY